jgi:hypothetical protein
MSGTDTPASPETPVYAKMRQPDTASFWMITCDEGWRSLIVCTDMYENVADWLLGIIDGKPYPAKAAS